MSFKLFTQVSEVTKPPPVGADPCVCPTPKGVTLRLNRWNMSFRHWADTWVRPYNREVTALPKLKLFIISVAKLRNKIENAETKREKCWSKREKCWSGTGDRSVSYPFFSGYERNEAFPQDTDLSPVPGWSEGGDTLK